MTSGALRVMFGGSECVSSRLSAALKTKAQRNDAQPNNTSGKEPLIASGKLPPELDFFKYTHGGKRKAAENHARSESEEFHDNREGPDTKRMRADSEGEDELGGNTSSRSTGRHRVATKGCDIPACIDSFEELGKRYRLSSLLFTNLAKNGYEHPTAIQSYGIPVLLEVGRSYATLFFAGPDCGL